MLAFVGFTSSLFAEEGLRRTWKSIFITYHSVTSIFSIIFSLRAICRSQLSLFPYRQTKVRIADSTLPAIADFPQKRV